MYFYWESIVSNKFLSLSLIAEYKSLEIVILIELRQNS
jgi:hypothetical protein